MELAETERIKKGLLGIGRVMLTGRWVIQEAAGVKDRWRAGACAFRIRGRLEEIRGVQHSVCQLEGDPDILGRASGVTEMEVAAITIEVADSGMALASKSFAQHVGGKDAGRHGGGVITFGQNARAVRGGDTEVANAGRAVDEIVSNAKLNVVVDIRPIVPEVVALVSGGCHRAAITMGTRA